MSDILARLEVYQKAAATAVKMEMIARSLPQPHEALQSQMRRASTSISFNIAEGAYEFSPGEKARIYRIARRSCGECLAILDHLRGIGSTHPELDAAKRLLDEVTAMLTTMIVNRTPAKRI